MTPSHIGFIMDGNRRYAKKRAWMPWKGHSEGAAVFENVLTWLDEIGVTTTTFYAFSKQNFARDPQEVDALMGIFRKMISRMIDENILSKHDAQIRFVGDISLFPEDIQDGMRAVEEHAGAKTIYLAMGYDGQEEIVRAAHRALEEGQQLTVETISEHLDIPSAPQLIIRTSGEKRTSNFLPWQSIYSEWCFVDKLWPEFTKEDLMACVAEYEARSRRFGN